MSSEVYFVHCTLIWSRRESDLAQENPQIRDKRVDLQKKLERWEIAGRELLHIGV